MQIEWNVFVLLQFDNNATYSSQIALKQKIKDVLISYNFVKLQLKHTSEP